MTEPYGVGTVSVANGGTIVTGTSTFWVGKVRKNDLFTVPAQGLFARVTADPTENDELAINGWPGTDLVDAEYEIISTYIAVDTASRTRELLLGLSLIDPNYDVQVDDLAGRAAYDTRPGPTPTERGFAVLVSDIGDGRSAIYSKVSNASADWSDAAYFSGPTGGKGWSPQLVAESDGERRVLKLAGYVGGEGTEPTANVGEYLKADGTFTATIGDAVDIRGEGFVFRGAYGSGTAYALGDVTRESGSSWIALQATTGNAPPSLPTTSNAYWELLAAKGQDGTGTGDIVGPAGATDNRIAVYDGASGKLLKDGGKLVGDIVTGPASATAGRVAILDATGKEIADGGKTVAELDATKSGALVQSVRGTYLANADLSANIPIDDTVPLSTEGTQIINVSITPKFADSIIRWRFNGTGTVSSAPGALIAALFLNSNTNASVASYVSIGTANYALPLSLEGQITPGSTSPMTVAVRVGANTGAARMNGNGTGRFLGGTMFCNLIVEEIRP